MLPHPFLCLARFSPSDFIVLAHLCFDWVPSHTHTRIFFQAHLAWSPSGYVGSSLKGDDTGFYPGGTRGVVVFLNLFLIASAISCLDMNGNDRNFATLLLSVLFLPPALLVLSTPSCKSKSRLGFNDGHSWSLGQALIATGGALFGPLPTTLSRLLWDPQPPSHPVWWRAALKHPARHPSPRTTLCKV